MDEALQPFLDEAWCAELLRDPTYTVAIPACRQVKGTGEDELVARTLNTSQALPSIIQLYKTPASADLRIEEVLMLYSLREGLAGFPRTAHGGMVATILDETLGCLITVNMLRGAFAQAPAMTAYLNTTFLNPVPVPGNILCRAKVDRAEGRKLYVSAAIEDGAGVVLAKGEAMFVYVKGML